MLVQLYRQTNSTTGRQTIEPQRSSLAATQYDDARIRVADRTPTFRCFSGTLFINAGKAHSTLDPLPEPKRSSASRDRFPRHQGRPKGEHGIEPHTETFADIGSSGSRAVNAPAIPSSTCPSSSKNQGSSARVRVCHEQKVVPELHSFCSPLLKSYSPPASWAGCKNPRAASCLLTPCT